MSGNAAIGLAVAFILGTAAAVRLIRRRESHARAVLPQWSPAFFGALGALTVLTLDGVLDRTWGNSAHYLAAMLFFASVVWWGWFQRRLPRQ